jgi:hypothetical protein
MEEELTTKFLTVFVKKIGRLIATPIRMEFVV